MSSPNFKQVRLTQERFLALAKTLLAEGWDVQFTVTGRSMRPFLLDGDEVVVTPCGGGPKLGAVVMAWTNEQGLMVHRVVKIGVRADGQGWARLAGDGLLGHEVDVDIKSIDAVVEEVRRGGVSVDMRPRLALVWRYTRTIRSWAGRIGR